MGRRSNFSFSKRQRELKKKRKAQEKLARKRLRRAGSAMQITAEFDPGMPNPGDGALTVTGAAVDHLAGILSGAGSEEAPGLLMRVEQEPDGHFAIVPGSPRHSDSTFLHQGIPVLAIDSGLAEELGGRTLDVVDDEEDSRLVLR